LVLPMHGKLGPGRTKVHPRRLEHLHADVVETARNQRPRGAGVSSAAELPRKLIDVDIARAAKGHLDLAVSQVTEKDGQPRAGDGSRVLDDPVQIIRSQRV